jgi:histidyl-tRNA synthetase
VEKELHLFGIPQEAIETISTILRQNGQENWTEMRDILAGSEIGQKGLDELSFVLETVTKLGIKNAVPDFTLARGLDYYTGAIFEVTHPDFNSSICGGGRYDDLTGIFGLKDMSGVGISFGADRIYDLMLEKNLFPTVGNMITQLLFINFGDHEAIHVMELLQKLRAAGINSEMYPEPAK